MGVLSFKSILMSIEGIQEKERKIREKTEEERKIEITQEIERRHEKERLFEIFEKDKKLTFLKAMIERGLIQPNTAEAMITGEDLEVEEIEMIFEKINEIEDVKNIDDILPKELRVNRDEYVAALKDEEVRVKLLTKIDASLGHLYQIAHPNDFSIVDFFSHFIGALNRNLVKVQENTIDIKRSLQK